MLPSIQVSLPRNNEFELEDTPHAARVGELYYSCLFGFYYKHVFQTKVLQLLRRPKNEMKYYYLHRNEFLKWKVPDFDKYNKAIEAAATSLAWEHGVPIIRKET